MSNIDSLQMEMEYQGIFIGFPNIDSKLNQKVARVVINRIYQEGYITAKYHKWKAIWASVAITALVLVVLRLIFNV